MTTYTAITAGEIDADSPITTGLMTLMRDNPIAITEGASGAPKIQAAALDTDSVNQAAIQSNVVGQSELKTTFEQLSGSQYFTATGGFYIIGHTIDIDNGTILSLTRETETGSGAASFVARWRFVAPVSGNEDDVALYYVNTSPPYDHGDGLVALYAFAKIDNATGEIKAQNIAPDPPWLYNGPTRCDQAVAVTVKDSAGNPTGEIKKYRARREMGHYPDTLASARAKGPSALAAYASEFKKAETVFEEITDALKHADMNIIPTPWSAAEPGETYVMLDPVSDAMHDLLAMSGHDGAEPVTRLIKNYFKIGNTPLNRTGPAGLQIVSANWKKTP